MPESAIRIDSIHVGLPREIDAPQGKITTSICRTKVAGPIQLNLRGLQGDAVGNSEAHGWPNMAVCCQTLEDYRFWKETLDLDLPAGWVGENWTLENASETEICLMDIYDVGEARVQVSKPRAPCQKQSWRVGRRDWIDQVVKAARTGFYLSVLRPGLVQAGNEWKLVDRTMPDATVTAVNHCWYHDYDEDLARQLRELEPLDANMAAKLESAESPISENGLSTNPNVRQQNF